MWHQVVGDLDETVSVGPGTGLEKVSVQGAWREELETVRWRGPRPGRCVENRKR